MITLGWISSKNLDLKEYFIYRCAKSEINSKK